MPHKFCGWYVGVDCLAAAGLWVTMFPCIAARIVCVSHVNISKYLSLLVIPPVGSQSTRTILCESQKIWPLCSVDCGGPAIDSPLLSVLLHQVVWGQCVHAFFISNPCGSVESCPTKALSKAMHVSSTVTLDIVCSVAFAHSVARCWGLTLPVQSPCHGRSSIPSSTQ